MFQDALVQKLLTKLNANSLGVTFRGGYLIQQTNDKFQFTTYTNYYTSTTTEYTPVMFDLQSTPKNVPGKQIYDWVIDCTFSFDGESDTVGNIVNQKMAVDEFRTLLINSPIDTVTSGSTTFKIVTSATDITTISDSTIVNGKKRVMVSMQVYVQSGIDITYGNEVVYSIKTGSYAYETLDTIVSSDTKGKSLDSAQVFGTTSITNVAMDGSYQYSGTIIYKNTDVHNEIVKDIIYGNAINLQYTFKISFPNLVSQEKNVILSSGSINANKGELITITLTFVEA